MWDERIGIYNTSEVFNKYLLLFWSILELCRGFNNFFFLKEEEILSMYYVNYVVTILLGVFLKTKKSNESGLTFSDIET